TRMARWCSPPIVHHRIACPSATRPTTSTSETSDVNVQACRLRRRVRGSRPAGSTSLPGGGPPASLSHIPPLIAGVLLVQHKDPRGQAGARGQGRAQRAGEAVL